MQQMDKLFDAEEALVNEVFRSAFRFPPELTIDIWADANRTLSTKESAIPGKWETSRTPYLREVMECLSPSHPCQRVVLMGGTQTGKTEVIVNRNGFTVDQDPCPSMNAFPTISLGTDFSIQRFKGMIDNTPCVRRKMSPEKSRDSSNTITRKEFDGGIIFIVAGTSEIGLISRPIKIATIDEADQLSAWVIPMVEERMTTFEPYNKLYIVSVPKKKLTSIIANEYKLSDQRKYNIACPECGTYQVLVWNNMKFDRDDHYNLDSEVTYACMGCGDHISEHKMKADMENRAKWIPENHENGQCPGFHLPQFYSTLGSASWERAVKQFLKFTKLKKDKNPMYLDLQEKWTNNILAEPWEEEAGESASWEVLYNRREDYSAAKIDDKVLLICTGVDVQVDRIEIQVIGIGLNYQIWVIEYKHIYGKLTDPTIWAHLDQFLLKTYNHPCGKMRILGTAIDTGYLPDEVCEFVKTRYIPGQRYVFGIKGSSLYNQPIVRPPSKNKGIYLFSIGTDTVKDKLARYLKVVEPGPGYVHFPLTLPEVYFRQLCAERKKKEWDKKDRRFRDVWTNPSRARNEAWDTFVYAIAALNILRFLEYPSNNTMQMLELLSAQMKGTETQSPLLSDGESPPQGGAYSGGSRESRPRGQGHSRIRRHSVVEV